MLLTALFRFTGDVVAASFASISSINRKMSLDALAYAAFEERASAAEARLGVLERMLAKSIGAGPVPLPTPTKELEELRDILLRAKDETDKLKLERDEAMAARTKLEEENSKLKYQIMHLKRAVVEGDEKLKKYVQ